MEIDEVGEAHGRESLAMETYGQPWVCHGVCMCFLFFCLFFLIFI
jgi:hypothetical protein